LNLTKAFSIFTSKNYGPKKVQDFSKLVSHAEKDRLLRKYWSVPERQISTSVVLADEKWFEQKMRMGPLSS